MARLQKVSIERRSIRKYRSFFNANELKRFNPLRKELNGKRILHVNATPIGGGVAEMLQTLIPLQDDIGLKSDWYVIDAPARFFVITKEIHNGLQGKQFTLKKSDLDFYRSVNRELGTALSKMNYDIAVIHDPQPMALIGSYHQPPMISRIHIDLSSPDRKLLKFLYPYLSAYEKTVFSLKAFAPKGLRNDQIVVLPPAIDPLNKKNQAFGLQKSRKMLKKLGLNICRPIVSQVSRFDPWKNPLGVVEAYQKTKKQIPDVQLILMGIRRAKDDPEAVKIYKQVEKATKGDPDIHLFHDAKQLAPYTNEEVVNAIQVASDIILQLSIREGFGLTVTEAMWKGSVVIGGPAAGIRSQITDQKDGFIASTPSVAAKDMVRILKHPKSEAKIGKAAQKTVRSKHLITHQLLAHLELYKDALTG
ncbi:glycosyltransferase [Candidatus Uhrbacteria bacterium]|nr:glycosyltransferase [Candidatus Uhrbacteria bacterium]MBD3284577.1 glycosyltransferase [Candidatus Uhrbacteria bacterium]